MAPPILDQVRSQLQHAAQHNRHRAHLRWEIVPLEAVHLLGELGQNCQVPLDVDDTRDALPPGLLLLDDTLIAVASIHGTRVAFVTPRHHSR